MNINFKTRQLIRSASRGYLSTEFVPKNFKKLKLSISKPFSYSTFVMTAFDYDLSPLLLLSNLSEHTTNIINNSSVSLMVCEENNLYNFFPKFKNKFPGIDYEDPMSRPRVTLIGNIKKTTDTNHRRRFLNRHPAAKLYSNFGDMNFYKIEIKTAHLIGGFAHVKWFKKNELVNKQNLNYINSEANIISHMNDHHNESIKLYLQKFIKNIKSIEKRGNWKIVGIDPDGFDLRKKKLLTRLFFDKEISNAKKLRGMFVKLHKEAIKN
ncbi:MAG: hypothetical protein CL572_01390 [Alphaproteobacteria bacterium]|jgi:putative heme iron utilization protein|nr:hypothetical protein [Alphaproteobacteria bacterium]